MQRNWSVSSYLVGCFSMLTLLGATSALAESHEYITSQRSSSRTYIYFQQSIEGEYGQYKLLDAEGLSTTSNWQGTNMATSIGTEIARFVQLEIGYSNVTVRRGDDKLERLTGARAHAGLRLDFNAPLFNLELGGGAVASTLDYTNHEETASYGGTGYYGSAGINRFIGTHFSLYTEFKVTNEHMTNTGGAKTVKTIDAVTRGASLGFRIWF